ncbi:hypothetical protein Tco_0956315 [Tanacetum coccineum]
MGCEIMNDVKSLWRFMNDYDLRVSDELEKELGIPDESKWFVFAIKEQETQAVVYVVCVQNLSERFAVDVEHLVRCVRPSAVVAQVNEVDFDDVGRGDKYENVTGSLVLKKIFGVGFNGHFWAAKRMVEEVDDYVHSQIVKSLCTHLVQLSCDQIHTCTLNYLSVENNTLANMVVLSGIHISEGSCIGLSYNKLDQPLQLHGTGVNTGLSLKISYNIDAPKNGWDCARHIVTQNRHNFAAWNCYYKATSRTSVGEYCMEMLSGLFLFAMWMNMMGSEIDLNQGVYIDSMGAILNLEMVAIEGGGCVFLLHSQGGFVTFSSLEAAGSALNVCLICRDIPTPKSEAFRCSVQIITVHGVDAIGRYTRYVDVQLKSVGRSSCFTGCQWIPKVLI